MMLSWYRRHGGTAPRPGELRAWRYDDQQVLLKKGEAMGRFLLGSTVVMLLQKGVIGFNRA